jgi:tetratricopeptide (TPR) repeat protein
MTPGTGSRLSLALVAILLAGVALAYANHFGNAFHFDDAHTIEQNPYIRSLRHVPEFWTNAATFSTLPANRTWRPVVSTTLALDYWLGGGLRPFFFHLDTFLWYLLELVLLFFLFRRIFDLARADGRNAYLAFFAAAWYGLHPANAETVNYVIQRGDVLSTLGVVAALYLYAASPRARRTHLYLVPATLGQLAKPPALVFPLILLAYICLFEGKQAWKNFLPSAGAAGLMAALQAAMSPATFAPGAVSPYAYRITQPLVALRHFGSFFLPLWLSADTDHQPLDSLWRPGALVGIAFVLALGSAAYACSRRREWRPIAFGLCWFLLAGVPAAAFPVSEVENDHRMFFPFVGLAMSVVWALGLAVGRARRAAACLAVLALGAYGWGTWQRNRVWLSEETLWRDVALKSPRNGRGLMNYGLTLMARGDFPGALENFQRAAVFTPDYSLLEINLGIASGALRRPAEAESHFLRAITLAPRDAQTHFYYGRWLEENRRTPEALAQLRQAAALNPDFLDSQYLLLRILAGQRSWAEVRGVTDAILRLAPGDPAAIGYLETAAAAGRELAAAEQAALAGPSPERFLTLSLLYHQAGRFQQSIDAARQALRLKPDYAEAYNNIAAAYEGMEKWDEAIAAAREALRLRPDFPLARNNLAWSEAQKLRK